MSKKHVKVKTAAPAAKRSSGAAAARSAGAALGFYLAMDGSLPQGYHRLLDSPEISSCVNRISAIVSSPTIYLMRNTRHGDKRVRDRLARFVDVDPWPGMATRASWMSWIVSTMLTEGDGNAFVLPVIRGGLFQSLLPMPGAVAEALEPGLGYRVLWEGQSYSPDELLHFRLHADLRQPWKGRGYRVQARELAASLKQTSTLKDALSSPDYKPPLIVSVDTDADLSDPVARETFRAAYLDDVADGKPWLLPSGLMKVEQVKPLSLTDLAVKDTVELDKRTVASIFGVPPFLLGLGSFDQKAYNNFIRTVVIPICQSIEQELTLKLLESDDLYFTFNRRRLYAYDLRDLIDIDLAMSDRGYINGDEVRETAYRDPAGLTDYRPLENFIPYDMAGQQSKLTRPTGDPPFGDEKGDLSNA